MPVLLRLSSSDTPDIRAGALKGLSMVGYALPVRGRGVRILSIDGGGTRWENRAVCNRRCPQEEIFLNLQTCV